MVDQPLPHLAPEYDMVGCAHAIDADQQTTEGRGCVRKPKVVLVVGVDAEHVYMMVAASWPGLPECYIPILPLLANEMQPDPVTPIPPNSFLSPTYLNFTHIIRGRPVVVENGQRRRAPVPCPERARLQQPGHDASSPPISLSARELSYLKQCHRDFWSGVQYEKRAELPSHLGGKENGSSESRSSAIAALSGGDGAMVVPGSPVGITRDSAGHEATEKVEDTVGRVHSPPLFCSGRILMENHK